MKCVRLAFASSVLLLTALPGTALAKPVYLSCPTTDPAWPPPLTIALDEDRGDATVSDPRSSGSSPNPVFTADSVEFGYDGSRFIVSRVDLSLVTTDFVHRYKTTCKLSAPKRAF